MVPTARAPFLLFLKLLLTRAVPQNVTVDDAAATGVIPQYLPSPAWTQGATCSGCGAQPDPARAFDGTWHDATFTPSDGIAKAIEFTFTGSALYIFFILANTIQFVDTVTNMNFILDDVAVGTFVHNPSASTDFEYDVPVFVTESLSSGQHHMRMEAAGNRSALILFDYLVYTSDAGDSAPPISSSPSTSAPETQKSGAESTSSISSPSTSASSVSSSPSASASGTQKSGTDASASSISSSLSTSAPTVSSSPSSSSPLVSNNQDAPSKSNVAPIIGGTLAGVVVALSILIGVLLCYWRRKRPNRGMLKPDHIVTREMHSDGAPPTGAVPGITDVHPFVWSHQTVPMSSNNIPGRQGPSSKPQGGVTNQTDPRANTGININGHARPEEQELLSSNSHHPNPPPTAQNSSSDTTLLREQVGLLLDEVVRLRHLHIRDQNAFESLSESEAPPPGYSEGRASHLT